MPGRAQPMALIGCGWLWGGATATAVLLAPLAQAAPWRTYHSDLGPDQQSRLHQVDEGSLRRQGDRVSGAARIRTEEVLSTRMPRSYSFTVFCRAGTLQESLTPLGMTYQRRGSQWWSEDERKRGGRGRLADPAAESRNRAMDAQFTALWTFVCQPR